MPTLNQIILVKGQSLGVWTRKKTEKTTGGFDNAPRYCARCVSLGRDVKVQRVFPRIKVDSNPSLLTWLYSTWKYELIKYDRTVNRYHIIKELYHIISYDIASNIIVFLFCMF